MKKYYLLIFTLPLFLFCHCKKNNEAPIEQLPPITTTGANTFGCLINGEAWIADAKGILYEDVDAIVDELNNTLAIQAIRNKGDNDETFNLAEENIGEGIFQISALSKVYVDFNECGFFDIDTSFQRELNILKFDKTNKIISGTFYFTLIDENGSCPDTLIVTDGRFDATYRF